MLDKQDSRYLLDMVHAIWKQILDTRIKQAIEETRKECEAQFLAQQGLTQQSSQPTKSPQPEVIDVEVIEPQWIMNNPATEPSPPPPPYYRGLLPPGAASNDT